MEVPLLDLRKQYELIQKEIENAVQTVLRSGRYILGPNVQALEREVANYCGTSCAVGVASGTDALRLALLSLGIGKNDEVITTPFTFIATAEVITQVGATPVLVDIDEETFNIDADKIEEAVTSRTKALLPVHIFGHMVNMHKVLTIAKKHNLFVVEDAAQSFGSEYNTATPNSPTQWEKSGAMGDVGCFSFFPTKNLGGFGDGGMIATNNKEIARKTRLLRVHGGNTNSYSYNLLGYNSRLDELQTAILRVQFKYVDKWMRMRQERTHLYDKLLSDTPVKTPRCRRYARHSFGNYTIRTPLRDRLKEYLQNCGISTKVYYPIPIHFQDLYKGVHEEKHPLTVAERVCREVLSLPLYPELTEDKIFYTAEKIRDFFKDKY